MAAEEVLEVHLVLRSPEDEPTRLRPTNAVAEHEVQTPRNLVYKVGHVAFEAAVVIAEEQNTSALIYDDPVGEVDRCHAGKAPAVEDMRGAKIEHLECDANGDLPEEA